MGVEEVKTMYDSENIEQQVQEVLSGNKEAFRGIVEGYEARVRIILAAMLPDSSAVQDVAQEVLVTVYMKLSHYQPGTNFDAWVATITRNCAMNQRRKIFRSWAATKKYRTEIEHVLGPELDSAADDAYERLLPVLRECLSELGENVRGIFEAFYLESRSGSEIAERLGRREAAIRVILSRARVAVARCMRSKGAYQNV